MRVITLSRLAEFWERHPEAERALTDWYNAVRKSDWKTFAEIRATFANHADSYGRCVIFDVGGNKYRIIAGVHYVRLVDLKQKRYSQGRVYVRYVLTHKDYDKGGWKTDCV